MQERLRDVVARIGGSDRELAELLAAGTVSGEWPAFCTQVERGVALEIEGSDDLDAAEVRERVRALRRRHKLLSRAELRRWLEQQGLEADDLSGVARRALLRERDDGRELAEPAPEAVARVLWTEIACAGELRELAAPLALGVVAERRIGEAPPASSEEVARVEDLLAKDRASGMATLDPPECSALAARACALVAHGRTLLHDSVDESAVRARCRERALDWRRLEVEELHVPHEGAAREALLQARVEERDLAELSKAHGFRLRRLALRPEERPEALPVLRSAAAGDLLGPAPPEAGGGCVVMHVLATSPADVDPALQQRAAQELEAEIAARLTAGMVSWREGA